MRPVLFAAPLVSWLLLTTAQAGTPTSTVKHAAASAPAYLPYTAATLRTSDTLASLRQRFGKDQVQAAQIPGAEEEDVPGWVVYPNDPRRRIYIYLDDSGRHPDTAMVRDMSSQWQRADGVHAGMGLAELVKRNGKMLEFSGFGWDDGGYVIDWRGGNVHVAVRLCEPDFPNDTRPKGYPIGEGTFASSLSILQRFPPKVCEFALPITPTAQSSVSNPASR